MMAALKPIRTRIDNILDEVLSDGGGPILFLAAVIVLLSLLCLFLADTSFAQVSLPGSDASDKLEAAGTLMRIVDTGLFKWGARLFAGLCIMSAGWSLKEQRFGVAVICILGAIIFGTAPKWVKNIFDIGGNQSIFSSVERPEKERLNA